MAAAPCRLPISVKAGLERAHRRGGTRLDAELGVNILQMLVYGAMADREDVGDVAVGLARREPAHHFALASGEQLLRRRRATIELPRVARSLEQPGAAKQAADRRAHPIEQRDLAVAEVAATSMRTSAKIPTS